MNQWRFVAGAMSALFLLAAGGPAQAGPTASGLILADFNNDGLDDVLFRNTAEGFVGWWYLDGTQVGTANPKILNGFGVPDPGAGFELLAAGDFNEDGFADVLWRETATGNLILWLMGNLAITSSVNLGFPPAGLSVAGVGDIDANGATDILFRQGSGAGATVAAWLLEDDGAGGVNNLGGVAIGTIDSNWVIVAVKNVDGAGGDDILFRNTTDGFVGWWTLDASAATPITNGAGVPDPGSNFEIRGFATINAADDRADVIWRNASTGDLIAWLMNADLTIASAPPLGNPGSFSVPGVGDLDGNAVADFVFRDATSLATWLFSGEAAFQAGDSIGSIGSNWVVQNTQNTDAN